MSETAPGYAELHCLSNFSFLTGASHPEELVRRAHELGYAALALTDECSLAGVVRAHVKARDCGLALILGSEIRLIDGPRLVVLAADREGYGDLSELVTRGRRRAGKGAYELGRADLTAGFEGCLALWLPSGDPDPADGGWLAERFPGRAWIGVELHRGGRDRAWLEALRGLSAQCGLPLVACGGALMHERGRRALQDTLTAIRLGVPLAEAGHALQPNAERHLRRRAGLARLYPPELLAETLEVVRRCTFSLEELRYEYPDELVPPGRDPGAWLRELTEQGLQRRWPGGEPAKVRRLVEHELSLIAELRYEPYFLTVHDIVRFARGRGILCQGRGSAANSAVCYALGITEVDPARMELLFERFISRERDEPPDIDVDFEHQRREEVIQYVYGRYGRDRAALAATVISYRPKSAVRDVGKALGLDLDQVDRLAHNLTWWDGRTIDPERVREAGLDPGNPLLRRVLVMSREILGFPRHLSQHVGGFVISRGPLSRLVPIENAAMAERTVIQWDKDDLEALGLLKVDCLALGMLSAVRRAFDLVNGYRGWRPEQENRQGATAPGYSDVKGSLETSGLREGGGDSRSTSAPAGDAGAVEAAAGREPGGPGPGAGASGPGGSRSTSAPTGGVGIVGAAAGREPGGPGPGAGASGPGGSRSTSAPTGGVGIVGAVAGREPGGPGPGAGASGPGGSRSTSAPTGGVGIVGAVAGREPGGPGPGAGASGPGGSRSTSAPTGGVGIVGAAASREPGGADPPGPGNPLGLHNVPPEDPAVYAMIRRADTLGVFQIESRAQMAMLPRLRPECFYDLVIEVAIVRPGPIQGDMVHPYLKRRQGLEEVTYPSESVREVLGRTLGVPIFQEQVIKVAMVAAGFTPGEADRLRRSIAAWRRRGTLEQFEDRLIRGMTERGYGEAFARRIYQQILGFGEYGFPESHAASFALLVYVSAWLKRHEPAAFFAALLNSQPMGFYAPAQLVQAARRAGVEVRAVDVHASDGDCTLEPSRAGAASPPAMRLGLLMVKGLSRAGAGRLLAARAERPFRDVQDLARRARLDRRDLESLAAADALSGLAGDRHRAAWEVTGVQTSLPLFELAADAAPPGRPVDAGPEPDLPAPTEGQAILADYVSLGLTLRRHPLALLRRQLSRRGLLCAEDLDGRRHGERVHTGGLVINRQRPASANNVTFVTLEDETGQINLVIWRQVAERQRLVMLNARLLGVVGDVQREGGVLHVVARRLLDHSDLLGRLPTRSRDFR